MKRTWDQSRGLSRRERSRNTKHDQSTLIHSRNAPAFSLPSPPSYLNLHAYSHMHMPLPHNHPPLPSKRHRVSAAVPPSRSFSRFLSDSNISHPSSTPIHLLPSSLRPTQPTYLPPLAPMKWQNQVDDYFLLEYMSVCTYSDTFRYNNFLNLWYTFRCKTLRRIHTYNYLYTDSDPFYRQLHIQTTRWKSQCIFWFSFSVYTTHPQTTTWLIIKITQIYTSTER
jgi:hypothetical protein